MAGRRTQLHELLRLALPITTTMILTISMQTEDQIIIGHLLDRNAMAGAAVGFSVFNMFWFFLLGMGTAIDTLCSQAHGARDSKEVALWAQRGAVALLGASIPICCFMFFGSEWLLSNVLMQDPPVATKAALYVRLLVPGMPPLVLSEVVRRFLQAQSIMKPALVVALIANIANIALDVTLIGSLGFVGAPLATTICRYVQFIVLMAYTLWTKSHLKNGDWPGWNVSEILDWGAMRNFLVLAMSGGLNSATEGWSFEITVIFAGLLHDVVALDAHFIMMSFVGLMFVCMPFSVAIASSVRIGTLLGGNQPVEARTTAWLGVGLGTLLMLGSAIFILVDRRGLGRIYTKDKDVIALIAKLAVCAAIFQVFDGVQGTAAGALRGMGKQVTAAVITLIGFAGCGTLTGYLLTFNAGLGVIGLWWGFVIAITVTAVMSLFVLARSDFVAASEKAIETAARKSGTIVASDIKGDLMFGDEGLDALIDELDGTELVEKVRLLP